MKTTHRSIPNDIFSVEESGASIRILSNHRLIHVYTTSHDGSEFSGVYSFQDFLNALQSLLIGIPLSPPSQPDKEATAPAVDAKQAAPEPIDMSRWNWTHMNGLWHVCESDHHRSQGCEWRPATVKELIQAVETGVIKELREENHG